MQIIEQIPRGFKRIGTAIIIESNRDYGKYDKEIGAEILRKTKAESVFLKIEKIKGRERVPKLKLIAGKNKSVFLTKENGCLFYVNLRRCFFDPSMQNERKRIYELVKSGEKIIDMFSGVGPFSILLAKKAKIVYAIEINHYAYSLLKRNIELNKVKNVIPLLGDAKEMINKIEGDYDRIIMNLPSEAEKFLSFAINKVNKGVIHLYKFVRYYDSDLNSEARKISNLLKDEYKVIKNIDFTKCGDVSPYTSRVCFDIYLEK
ncbi:MAG: methyltransferase [Candidatus Rehaiarchaeum fermentans]|nr:methyltransferase [Candidatus Rehaiarchaeum fermentans]MCW1302065.1 methyltransferase [Candidatus Rehaiarchaeum fermentans]